jgi:hypothetical protein
MYCYELRSRRRWDAAAPTTLSVTSIPVGGGVEGSGARRGAWRGEVKGNIKIDLADGKVHVNGSADQVP